MADRFLNEKLFDKSVESQADNTLVDQLKKLLSIAESVLPPTVEIVLHDITRLPYSIVGVAGRVTNRRIGDPATDLLLQLLASGASEAIGYTSRANDGRELRSSTVIFRDGSGGPVAAVCINNNVSAWQDARNALRSILDISFQAESEPAVARGLPDPSQLPQPAQPPGGEFFPHDIDELAGHLIKQAIADVGIAPDLMRKEHKLRVVMQLKSQGLFLIKEAVNSVAEALNVSRFSIYNYINEIDETTNASGSDENS